MKFMKLGSKPDTFQADGKFIRFVNYALEADIIIKVDEVKFYLHKFPLMSKSNRLLRLVAKAQEEGSDEINLVDFPGAPKAFEICAKFCYGMTVTLNAYNVVAARCAAEYLEMTEDIEHGNLVFNVEVFLSSCILRSWKDSIIVLQTTKVLLPESETLKIVGRCVDSVASKASLDVENVYWSYTYSRKSSLLRKENLNAVPVDWWVEDTCELEIDLFTRVMAAIKCKGRIDGGIISEALETYAVRWLTECTGPYISDAHKKSNKSLVETIICLLPADNKGGCIRCAFLVKLLKVGIAVGLNESSQRYLAKRIGSQLQEASIEDLLIRARPTENTAYDYGLVKSFVREFIIANEICMPGHESLLTVGRLIDRFLAKMAHDPNVEVSSFAALATSLPEAARPVHDGLYKAIDIYLRKHPSIEKPERKQLCQLMDVKKLTSNASMHAARNEQLPLRVVVQVLFFEQLRTGAQVQACRSDSCDDPSAVENEGIEKVAAGDHRKLIKMGSTNSARSARLLPSRSWKMLEKFNFYHSRGNTASRSSETSGSSQSQACLVPKEAYMSSVLRQRRYSVS